MQRCGGARGWVAGPQSVDQRIDGNLLVGGDGENRKYRSLAASAERQCMTAGTTNLEMSEQADVELRSIGVRRLVVVHKWSVACPCIAARSVAERVGVDDSSMFRP